MPPGVKQALGPGVAAGVLRWGGAGWVSLAQASPPWSPGGGSQIVVGSWHVGGGKEAADVGHLFWKFGSEEKGKREAAQAAGSREMFLVVLFFVGVWGGVLEEAANERKT